MTSNNTIHGTEWHALPDVGGAPLVCDASSDIFSRPIDVSKFGLIYAGAQKNLGPSGVTVVIVREDLLARSADSLPTMLNYKTQAENGSLYNTPPVFGIYILRLVLKWLTGERRPRRRSATINERKAKTLYDELDRTEFWRPHADTDSRSLMNVTFRLPSEELEKLFVKESHRRRVRRPERPSVGRRPARVDLQRVSRAGRDGSRRVHEGVRAENTDRRNRDDTL